MLSLCLWWLWPFSFQFRLWSCLWIWFFNCFSNMVSWVLCLFISNLMHYDNLVNKCLISLSHVLQAKKHLLLTSSRFTINILSFFVHQVQCLMLLQWVVIDLWIRTCIGLPFKGWITSVVTISINDLEQGCGHGVWGVHLHEMFMKAQL